MQTGICTNIGNCTKADAGEKLQLPVGAPFVCPECGKDLSPIGRGASGGGRPVWVIPVVGLLLLLGLAFGVWKMFSKPGPQGNGTSTETSTAPTVSEAPAGTQTILRLSGSNTIGSKLGPALIEEFLKSQGAQNIQRVPGAKDEMSIVATLPGQSSPSAIEVKAHGSKTAFEDLGASKADIGMASRKIKNEEKEKLSSLGDLTSRASENVLGLDGLAIIVNQANSLDALTSDKIRDIFTGKITDWSQVGGSPGPIQIYARDDKSGTFDTFKELVLRGETLASSAKRFEDSTELSNAVADDTKGIGFIGMPYILSAKALKVSEGGSVPLRPTVLTVRTEDYLLSRRLYLYTPGSSQNSWVRKFVEFSLSDPGQAIVDKIGFVGQALTQAAIPKPDEAVVATNLPPDYARMIQDAERLPFNFRFNTGSYDLDTKAYRDLGRLVQFMGDRSYQGRRIILLGFTDSVGSAESNLRLSRDRAHAVERELVGEGIKPAVVEGFGKELPVAGNDTEEGRQKNRRVEVWLGR
jgi:phosphate transport system substrate-binding protein